MDIYYVTSNKAKFEEASLILDNESLKNRGITIHHAPFHLDEIQDSRQKIAMHKMKEAFSHIKGPCIIDDVSLVCPCLGGLPGPYIRPFLEALGDKQFAELIAHYQDRSCSVICTITFAHRSDTAPQLFEGIIHGKIVPPRGLRKHGTSWNAIVEPQGFTETYAEMSLQQMSTHSPRSKALGLFKNFLLSEHS